jgi:transposase InsO family protein
LRLEHGIRVGRKRVERLMAANGISGLPQRRRKKTTVRLEGVRAAPDLVERDFNPEAPDRTWSADITYIRTWEGWLYLAHVQDLFSRRIVGWAMADHLRAELVIDALEMAIGRRRPGRWVGASLGPGVSARTQPVLATVCSSVNVRMATDGLIVATGAGGDAAVVAEARPEGGPERR